MHERPRLLLVAHGTASLAGAATTARVLDAVRAARADVLVDLCFLDVAAPRLADLLTDGGDDRPAVLVPLLLSTGYHVQTDIPAAVAGRPHVRVARHLGPDPLLAVALADRLPADAPRVLLVGAGSSRAEATDELAETGRLLARRIARPVEVATMADDLRARIRALAPVSVATYLLAEGQFVDTLRRAAAGLAAVAEPIGAHPALVRLVWTRYDEAEQPVR